MSDSASHSLSSHALPEVVFLPVESTSVGFLKDMAHRIFPDTYKDIIAPPQIEYMLHWMYAENTLRREIVDERIAYRWITVCGEKVGFLSFGRVAEGSPCPLHKLYLLPAKQRRGIGRAALEQLVSLVATGGATSLELRVNRHNAAAIRFYQKNGFTTYDEDCREIGGGFLMDDYLMRRRLSR